MSQPLRTLRRLCFGFLLAVVPLPATAQQGVSPADSAQARAFASLPVGAWVRLGAGAFMVSGTVVERDGATIRLRTTGGGHQTVEMQGIETIWIQRGRAATAGMRTGAVTGALVGVVMGVVAGAFMCESGCCGARVRGGVGGLAVGAGVGAIVGAAVGTVLPRWERLLP